MNHAIARAEFDNGHVSGSAAVPAAVPEIFRGVADDYSLSPHSFTDQVEVRSAGEVAEPEKEESHERLKERPVALEFLRIVFQPGDQFIGEGQAVAPFGGGGWDLWLVPLASSTVAPSHAHRQTRHGNL